MFNMYFSPYRMMMARYQMPQQAPPMPSPYSGLSPMPFGGSQAPLPPMLGGNNVSGILAALQQMRGGTVPTGSRFDPLGGPMPSTLDQYANVGKEPEAPPPNPNEGKYYRPGSGTWGDRPYLENPGDAFQG